MQESDMPLEDFKIDHQHEWRFLRQVSMRDIPDIPDSLVRRYDVFYCIHCLEYTLLEQTEKG